MKTREQLSGMIDWISRFLTVGGSLAPRQMGAEQGRPGNPSFQLRPSILRRVHGLSESRRDRGSCVSPKSSIPEEVASKTASECQ